MDKVHKPSESRCYTPSSEPFRFHILGQLHQFPTVEMYFAKIHYQTKYGNSKPGLCRWILRGRTSIRDDKLCSDYISIRLAHEHWSFTFYWKLILNSGNPQACRVLNLKKENKYQVNVVIFSFIQVAHSLYCYLLRIPCIPSCIICPVSVRTLVLNI
jgi:hypothetical protein